jgi:hypothetical protein
LAYKKKDDDFQIVHPTKTVQLSPSQSIGFFEEKYRENRLHTKVDKLLLEEDKHNLGQDHRYFK